MLIKDANCAANDVNNARRDYYSTSAASNSVVNFGVQFISAPSKICACTIHSERARDDADEAI